MGFAPERDWKYAEAKRFLLRTSGGCRLASLPSPHLCPAKCAQRHRKDLDSGQPMNRLLQGDVGSAKQVVALAAGMIL